MKIRALLFDAGDVLYHRPRRWQRTKAFLSELNLSYIEADHPARLALKRDAHAGRIDEVEYQGALLDLFGVKNPEDRNQGRVVLSEEIRDFEFFEGVPETLHKLKDMGFLLSVVTNTFNATSEKIHWFRQVGIHDIWTSFATSCELSIIKPNPKIYYAALNPLSVLPGEAAFVGHAASELKGAQALGMTTIAFNADEDVYEADHRINNFRELIDLATQWLD
jgi:FMN phosphatase YigB (HAD superfamily)